LRSMKEDALKKTPDQWKIYGNPPKTRELSVIITNIVNDYESRNDFAQHVYDTLKMQGEVQIEDVQKKFDVWMVNFKKMKEILKVDYEKTAEALKQLIEDNDVALRLSQQKNGTVGGTSTAAASATGATQMDGLLKYKNWMWRTLPLSVRNQIIPGDNQTSEGFKLLVQLHDWYEPIVQHFASQLGLAPNTGAKERISALDKWIEQMNKVKIELQVGTYSEIPAAVHRQLQSGATPAVTVPDAEESNLIEQLKRKLHDMETKLIISQRQNAMLEQRVSDAENGSFEPSRHFQLHEKLSNLLDELNDLLHIDFATDSNHDDMRMINHINTLICSALAGPNMHAAINAIIIKLMTTLYPNKSPTDIHHVLLQIEELMNGSYNPTRSRTDGGNRHERASDNAGHEPVQALTRGDETVHLAQPVTSAADQAAVVQSSARDGSATPRDEAGASHAAAAQSSARGNSAATAGAESHEAGARDPSQRSGTDEWFKAEVATGNMVVHKRKDGTSMIELMDGAAKKSPGGK
jgi:hypothetical protein